MSLYNSMFNKPVVINFSSKDRISGSNSNFFSSPIDLGVNRFDSVCMVSIGIPKSYYNFPSSSNTFTVRESAISTRTVTIPPGNYNKNTIITALIAVLNTGGLGFTYNVTYPAYTAVDSFKLTFTVSGNAGYQPSFIFQDRSSPFRQLGFDEGSTNVFVADSLETTNAINLQYILRMFIKSNVVRDATDGILEEVLSVGSFPSQSVIYWQQYNYDMNTRAFNSDSSNSWNFTLVDGFNQVVDLNGVPWSFSLVFYQRNDTHEIHKQDLQIQNEQRLIDLERAQRKLESDLVDDKDKDKEPEITASISSGILANSAFGTYVNPEPNQIYPVIAGTLVPKGLFPTIPEVVLPPSESKVDEENKE